MAGVEGEVVVVLTGPAGVTELVAGADTGVVVGVDLMGAVGVDEGVVVGVEGTIVAGGTAVEFS